MLLAGLAQQQGNAHLFALAYKVFNLSYFVSGSYVHVKSNFFLISGAKYVENCEVLNVETDAIPHSQVVPKVTNVITPMGKISCEYFVNAASMVS